MAEGVLREIAERKRVDVTARLAGGSIDPVPTKRSLRSALARPGARFIMEVKKASPSGHRSALSVQQAASAYAPVADAISASIQQLSGGVASVVAGHLVTQAPDGQLQHFSVIGYVVVATSLVALGLVWRLQRGLAAAQPAL